MENDTETPTELSTESNLDKNTIIKLSALTSSIIIVLFLVAFTYFVKKDITANQLALQQYNNQLGEIKQSLNVSRVELEKQVKDYIDTNYGVLSERDEKVDKLLIYFRQQDARLNNIEKALSKF